MHQPFTTSFAILVASIVARSPDADFWLSFESQWRKSMIHVLSSMGMVRYLVSSLIVSWIHFHFG